MLNAEIEFLPIDSSYLDASYEWLHDRDFAELTMTPNFSKADQLNWFNSLPRKDYFMLGIKADGLWVGGFGIKKIDLREGTAEYWVQIYPEPLRSRGIGKATFDRCKEIARELGVRVLYLYVSTSNHSALKAYEKWGFSMRESDREGAYRMTCVV